jgi:hypothetical protein
MKLKHFCVKILSPLWNLIDWNFQPRFNKPSLESCYKWFELFSKNNCYKFSNININMKPQTLNFKSQSLKNKTIN